MGRLIFKVNDEIRKGLMGAESHKPFQHKTHAALWEGRLCFFL